jgi:tetratricopeptide (TPR) repeat protein
MSVLRLTRAAAVAAFALTATTASALFLRPDLEKVPVERLAKNLREKIDKNPKDEQAVLNLARLHGMAYALRTDTVETNKRTPDAVWFGFEPPIVPFSKVEKVEDKERLKAAKEHLDKALKLYEEAIKLAPNDLRAQLGHAWLLTQTDKKAEAVAELRKVVEKAWDKEKDLKATGFGGHTVTAEAADYLIPLLDKDKDKEEIATLKERAEKLNKLPRPVTPIAVPLRPGLTATDIEDRGAGVAFDADGTGLRKQWTWITKDAAWLVHDPKRSGKISSALQLFGNVTFWLFWETGYDALAALDDNRDGRLSGKELDGLALWHDANGDGVSDAGEVKPLSAFGVVALSCKSQRDASHPDRIAYSPAGVTFRDGTTRPTFDLVLHPAE